MGLFGKKKNYADRNPNAAAAYRTLSPQQQKILDEFSYRESKNTKSSEKLALQRIAEKYVIPKNPNASEKQIRRETEMLFRNSVRTLQQSEVTTNVSAKLFAMDDFFNSSEVKTVWSFNTGKGHDYHRTRQAVEEHAFGWTVDWNVPLQRAAMMRPVYAGLNFSRHPYGAAVAYGSVALVYKPEVLHRSTFLHKDTFDNEFGFEKAVGDELERQRDKICTWAQMGILIGNMSDNQLKALMQVTDGSYVIDQYPPNYVEAQVLGGVQFARDLLEIRVATIGDSTLDKEAGIAKKTAATLKYLIGAFAKKNGVPARTYRLTAPVETLN